MLRHVLIGLALLVPQVATAADMPYRHHHHHRRHVERVVDENRVIRCTTSDWVLFTTASCGQGFDPLAVAAGR